ncbi:MAG: HD-GYP domain-containing protein [Roseburia sp.]
MIVYDRAQMAPSVQGKYPTLDSLYNTIPRNTREHMERVGRYSDCFFRELCKRFPDAMSRSVHEEFLAKSEEIFRYHDLGRAYIPAAILNKVGKLTDEEKQIIQNHTIYAGNAVESIYHFPYEGNLLADFFDIAMYHHERYDGGGYPFGKKAEEIPLLARICALADVFDGIVSWKPYKPKQTTGEKAGEIILSEAGKQFDPQLARIFVEIIPDLPVKQS